MTRVRIGGEKELLLTFLDQQRDVVVWKLEGLTDDQVRQRPLPSSGLYLLGLVKRRSRRIRARMSRRVVRR
jgi:Protein of unknown function (DUF664)